MYPRRTLRRPASTASPEGAVPALGEVITSPEARMTTAEMNAGERTPSTPSVIKTSLSLTKKVHPPAAARRVST